MLPAPNPIECPGEHDPRRRQGGPGSFGRGAERAHGRCLIDARKRGIGALYYDLGKGITGVGITGPATQERVLIQIGNLVEWGAIVAVLGVSVAGFVSAVVANRRAKEAVGEVKRANQFARGANQISERSNEIAVEANEIAKQANASAERQVAVQNCQATVKREGGWKDPKCTGWKRWSRTGSAGYRESHGRR